MNFNTVKLNDKCHGVDRQEKTMRLWEWNTLGGDRGERLFVKEVIDSCLSKAREMDKCRMMLGTGSPG
jgi:hypothetical protein